MSSLLPPNSFYVVSYPRSGNTWLINCLTLLLGGVRGEAYTPFKLYTELHGQPGAGFHFWCEPRARPDQPICVKSHDDLPAFRRRHPPGKIVYIARDARDSLLSYYFFQQAYAQGEELGTKRIQGTEVLTSRGGAEPTFDAAQFTQFLRIEAPQWAVHVRAAREDNAVCFVTYEGLKSNFVPTLASIATALGLPLAKSYSEVEGVYNSGFKKVFSGDNRDFFRRGEVGDWKNWYTAEHARLIDELIGADLRALGFEVDPAWTARYTASRIPSNA